MKRWLARGARMTIWGDLIKGLIYFVVCVTIAALIVIGLAIFTLIYFGMLWS